MQRRDDAPTALTRRGLLKRGVGALGGLSLLGCRQRGCKPKPQRVLIIGAGMAGLAAGQILRSQGHQVALLEGRSRVGGRVHTDLTMGTPIDLGAMILHGNIRNPLTPLLQRLNQPLHKLDYYNVRLTDHRGTHAPERLVRPAIKRFRDGLKAMEEIEELKPSPSLSEAFYLWLETQPDASKQLQKQLFSRWILPVFEMKEAAALKGIAMEGWADADACRGGDHLLPQSYRPLIHHLQRDLTIHLGQRVQELQYNPTGVTVITQIRRWEADRVIVTVPLGVLQRGLIKFTPALPTAKQEALQALGVGVLNKVILRFPRLHWPKDIQLFGYQSQQRGEFPLWLNYATHTGAPILMGVVGGPYGDQMEAQSDAAIVAQCTEILRKILGSSLPAPTAHLITRWRKDPFACGAYSHVPLSGHPSAYDDLATPVIDRLFFAGEATHRRYPTTVHGAYLSGIREAMRPAFRS